MKRRKTRTTQIKKARKERADGRTDDIHIKEERNIILINVRTKDRTDR